MSNRLADETSPYLLQHAHNPVDWYAWGEEAFAQARAQDRPVLLSVGYSACHWCHVMERESFENEQIARLMNEHFVSIKVDREERPDVDQIYMSAVQAMTGRGGWPMTVFLTSEGRPFYGGTYYPPEDRQGMPGFPRVLQAVAEAYRERRGQVLEGAANLFEHLQQGMGQPAQQSPVSPALLDRAAQGLKEQYDARFGGFGGAPKFPPAMSLEFLLRYRRRSGDEQALGMVEHTLRQMAGGGMYDQLGGGFHRYSVDQYWLVPHFEKMLYDNALLARIYLLAWQATGKAEYRRVAEETIDWVLRELTDPRGGFYSTLDADSEGVEGKFYVWTTAEVEQALAPLGSAAVDAFMRFYDVTSGGNFEGHNILHVSRDVRTVALELGLEPEALDELLAHGRRLLFEARASRIRPGLDDKVLTAWNGLMLRALAEAARVLERDDYRAAAERNAELVLTELRQGDRLLRSWKRGKREGDAGRAKLNGYLEDYAAYADGLLALYEATFEPRWLSEARTLADAIVARFWSSSSEDAQGMFFDTAIDHEQLIVRPRDIFDNATPAGNSLAADVLLRLAAVTGEERYRDVAERAIAPAAEVASRHANGFGRLLCALDFMLAPVKEVVVIGREDDPETRALLREVFGPYRPHKVVAGAAPDDPDAAAASPLLEGRGLVGGRPAAYVCEHFTCRMPVTERAALAAQLDG